MSRSSLRRTAHLLFVLWVLCMPAAVAEPPPAPYARWVEVYVFSRDGCPHCENEIGFRESLSF
jgi:hypothetical protein